MTPAEILERAADLIDERGWFGDYRVGRPPGSYCIATAINAMEGLGNRCIAFIPMSRALGGTSCDDIIKWNDVRGRTQDEVTSAMRATAAVLRAQSAVTPETVTA